MQRRDAHGPKAEDLATPTAKVHSLRPERSGRTTPADGLQSKSSGQADAVPGADKAGLAWALAMDTAQQPDLRAFIEAAS